MPILSISNTEVHIEKMLNPTFLQLSEKDDLTATKPIYLKGMIYPVDQWICIQAEIHATLQLPCATCNEPVSIDISLPKWTHQEERDSINHTCWDLSQPLREAILVEVPFLAYCGNRTCHNRKEIEKFLHKTSQQNGHQPFANLQISRTT